MEMNDATERKVEEGKQEIFTLRRVPSAKLARLGTNLALAQCCTAYYYRAIVIPLVSLTPL